jgi:hypothetical protein
LLPKIEAKLFEQPESLERVQNLISPAQLECEIRFVFRKQVLSMRACDPCDVDSTTTALWTETRSTDSGCRGIDDLEGQRKPPRSFREFRRRAPNAGSRVRPHPQTNMRYVQMARV